MANDPLWINASAGVPAYAANELRQAMALPMMFGGRNVGAKQGIRPGSNSLQVSLAGSTITVQPGVACVDPGLSTPQGPYWVAISPAETHTLTAAHVSLSRKDIVILRVYDHDEDSSGNRFARTEYIAGVAGSGTEPAVPPGAFRLATIDVPPSPGAPVVTNNAPFTAGVGGVLLVRNQAERDALSAYASLTVWRIDRGWLEVHDGTVWRVQGVATVASVGDLSSITSPYAGQLASNTGDNGLYRYTGSLWRPATTGLIAESVLTGTAASVLLPPSGSIPSGYGSLELVIQARGDTAAGFTTCRIRFNGDSAANYDSEQVTGSASTVQAIESINTGSPNGGDVGEIAAATATGGASGVANVKIPNPSGTSFWKEYTVSHQLRTGTGTGTIHSKHWAATWRSTAAITTITVIPGAGNFAAGSIFRLYGHP